VGKAAQTCIQALNPVSSKACLEGQAGRGLRLAVFVNPWFTNLRFFKLARWFKYGVFCKPWVVKPKES
jgi:hypothetical protein